MYHRFAKTSCALPVLLLAACQPELPPPNDDEVCWRGTDDPSSSCPDPQICLPEETVVTVVDPSSDGFVCGPVCKVDSADSLDVNFENYEYQDDDIRVRLSFKERIVLGYSLENFLKYFEGASIAWHATPRLSAGSATSVPFGGGPVHVDFLSYEPPILRVRIEAEANSTVTVEPVEPYVCYPGNKLGFPVYSDPQVCTELRCSYFAGGTDTVHVRADLEVPIQQPTP